MTSTQPTMIIPAQHHDISQAVYVTIVLHKLDPSKDVVHYVMLEGTPKQRVSYTLPSQQIPVGEDGTNVWHMIQSFRNNKRIGLNYLSVSINVLTEMCTLIPRDSTKLPKRKELFSNLKAEIS